MTPMTQRFAAGIRRYTDTRRLDLVADPRDTLIAAQAEQITVLEALVADLRKRLEAAERAGSRKSGNSSMPPSSDDLPGRKPPRGQRPAAERAEKKKPGETAGQSGGVDDLGGPDRAADHYPGGACPCGLDLADAKDLGITQSYQQEEIPAAPAERVQHDLHTVRCACGKAHTAPRPAGVPEATLSIGPRLRALAVYLVIFQHVPVQRCRQLIADVAGAAVSDGFIHSCLAKAADLAADVMALIRALITAAPVAGFDETTLRSAPAGEKKYVHGAFTEMYSAFWLGARSLDSMEDAGILPEFAGIVVSDRYQNYFHPRWEHIAGNQACLAHLLRDFEDCAESYPDAVWPVQAQRALRGMIHAWHAAVEQGLPAIPADTLKPLDHEFRHAVLAGLASVPRVPGPEEQHQAEGPAASCSNSARTGRTTCSASPRTRASGRRTTSASAASAPSRPSRRSPGAWPATTSPRTAWTSAATSTRPASTARMPWMPCTTSCLASPGDRQHSRSPVTAITTPCHPSPHVNGLNAYPADPVSGRINYGAIQPASRPPLAELVIRLISRGKATPNRDRKG
jgi:transposase